MEKSLMRSEKQSRPENSEGRLLEIPKEARRMKYFRKFHKFEHKANVRGVLKKNYCLDPRTPFPSGLHPPPNELKRLLERQKFVDRMRLAGMKLFTKRRNSLRYLKELKQYLSTQIWRKGFLTSSPRLSALRELFLGFLPRSRGEPNEFAPFIDSIGKFLKDLTHLNLLFSRLNGPKDQMIRSLVQQIRSHWKNIQHLNLEFNFFDLTNKDIQDLINSIDQDLKSLQSLSISFIHCPEVTHVGLKNLATKYGASLCPLQALKIYFSSNPPPQITEEGIEGLVKRIGVNLPTLQRLSLGFPNCPKISDKGMEYIAKLFEDHFKRLTRLHLNLSGCDRITDKGVKHVANHIMRPLRNLKSFAFDFEMSGKLTDVGIKALADEMKNLKGLTQLRFSFKDCYRVKTE